MGDHSREIAKGSFWNLLGNVFFKIVSFFYVIMVARAASQDDVGLFYLSLGVVSFISVFSDFGISGALVRFVPYFEGRGERGKIRELLKFSYAALLFAGILLTAALWLVADQIGLIYNNDSLPEAVRLLSSFILINNVLRLHLYFMQGMADIKHSQLLTNAQNISKLALTAFLFYFYGASVLTISAGFLISHVLVAIISAPRVLSAASSIKERDSLSKEEIIYSIAPLGLMIAVLQNFSNIVTISDRLILGFLSPPEIALGEVAIYSILTTLASVLFVFPSSVGGIFLPVFSRLAGQGEKGKMGELVETSMRWTALIAIPVGLVMIVFSGDLLLLFYGPEYAAGAAALSVFSAGLMISAASHIMWLALAGLRMIKVEMIIAASAGILNVALALMLVPSFGMLGSAAASAASFAMAFLLLLFYCGRLLSYRPGEKTLRLVIPSLLTFLGLLLLHHHLPAPSPASSETFEGKAVSLALSGILAALSYGLFGLLALLSGCFSEEDADLARKALERAGLGKERAEKLAGLLHPGRKAAK